jgi:poly(3-hydroxybutyrate) depolymerase
VLISYQLRELHRAAWAPALRGVRGLSACLRLWKRAVQLSGDNPFAAGYDRLARWCKDYTKSEFDLTKTLPGGKPVAVSETVVPAKPFCRLLQFASATPRTSPIALIVAPLSGDHATLLRDTVRTMLPDFDESADTVTLLFLRHEGGNWQVFPPETAHPAMRIGWVFE